MATGELQFIYTNAIGETDEYDLADWTEDGFYITGITSDGFRKFRKDRVKQYLTPVTFDTAVYAPPRPKPPKRDKTVPVVLFTGFKKADKDRLVAQAEKAGLTVSKARAVSGNTDCLVCGPTAGPAKLQKATELGVMVVDEVEFKGLVETGELVEALYE